MVVLMIIVFIIIGIVIYARTNDFHVDQTASDEATLEVAKDIMVRVVQENGIAGLVNIINVNSQRNNLPLQASSNGKSVLTFRYSNPYLEMLYADNLRVLNSSMYLTIAERRRAQEMISQIQESLNSSISMQTGFDRDLFHLAGVERVIVFIGNNRVSTIDYDRKLL